MSHALERAGAGTGTGLVSYGNVYMATPIARSLGARASENGMIRDTQGCYWYRQQDFCPTVSTERWCLRGCSTNTGLVKHADLITSSTYFFSPFHSYQVHNHLSRSPFQVPTHCVLFSCAFPSRLILLLIVFSVATLIRSLVQPFR